MTPLVCRASRALIGITQRELAKVVDVSSQTIADFERGARRPHTNNLKVLERFFHDQGIRYIEEDGRIVAIDFRKLRAAQL